MHLLRLFLAGLFALSAGVASHAYTPDLRHWEKLSANGARVTGRGPGKAVFIIMRKARGPKGDPLGHGYAYVLSGPLELPPDWRRVEISGEWWRMPFKHNAFPELALRIHARYPRFSHGDALMGAQDSNFIHIGYASWKPRVHYSETGDGSRPPLRDSAPAAFPEHPRGFMLTLNRDENGVVSWSFFESDDQGVWRRLFHVARSRLFEGVGGAPRIFVKIGGWNTWEYPVANHLRLRDLRVETFSWPGAGEILPGNYELNRMSGD